MQRSHRLAVPPHFHLGYTVYSHGWCSLPPFRVRHRPLTLHRVLRLGDASIVAANVRMAGPGALAVDLRAGRLGVRREREADGILSRILHFDLDLSPFHRLVRMHPQHAWMARRRAGRMLRGETFFEDAVKMILTTNCSWTLTETMVTRLVDLFGERSPDGDTAFPRPEAIADSSERFLRDAVRLGYRAQAVHELSQRAARGDIDLEAYRGSTAPAHEIYDSLRGIRGIGPYAAGNLLKLLGRYEYLGLDSWCRAKYAELYGNGSAVRDADIEARYAPFGEWRGLVMWLDLTRHWYGEKFPFETREADT